MDERIRVEIDMRLEKEMEKVHQWANAITTELRSLHEIVKGHNECGININNRLAKIEQELGQKVSL